MLKKFLAIVTVLTVMFTLVPVAFQVSAADESFLEDAVIVYNNTASSSSEDRFKTSVGINATYTKNDQIVHSKQKGYKDSTPLAVFMPGTTASWYPASSTQPLTPGHYDVYVWNIVCNNTDYFRSSTSTKATAAYHARYTVIGGNGTTVYYRNQATASGGTDGWVKLGTHYFSGNTSERLELSNDLFGSYAYASAVAFVPVNRPSSTKLSNIYMYRDYDKTKKIETEESAVTSNVITKHIPYDYIDDEAATRGDKRIHLHFETEDPGAYIKVNGNHVGTGSYIYNFKPTAGNAVSLKVTVTSEDGSKTEDYTVNVGIDKNDEVIDYKVSVTNKVTDNNFSTAFATGSGSGTQDSPAATNLTSGWGIPSENLGTTLAKIMGFGDSVTWKIMKTDGTPNVTSGYYSIYLFPRTNHEFGVDETAEVMINHNGLRERKIVELGKYHHMNVKRIYVGTYYFAGDGSETVTIIKNTQSTTTCLAIGGMKLVSSGEICAGGFAGLAITAKDEIVGIPASALEGGQHIEPLPVGDYTTKIIVKPVGTKDDYEYIKIAGSNVNMNSGKEVAINAADITNIAVRVKKNGEEEKIYDFAVCKAVVQKNLHFQRVQTVTNKIQAPINAEYTAADGKYIKTKNEVANFPANTESVSGYYKILVFKPGMTVNVNSNDTTAYTPWASASQPYTVGGKEYTTDWTSDNSYWIDLGNHYLDFDNMSEDEKNNAVTFTAAVDALGNVAGYTMLSEVAYVKLSDGVKIDNEFITLKELDDKVIYTAGTSMNITPYISGEPTVYINESLATTTATNIVLNDTLSRIKVRVENGENIKEYNFAVVKNASLINWDDTNVDITNNSASGDGTTGYNGTAAAVLNGDSAVYSVKGLVNGEIKVSVYGIPVTVDGVSGNYSVSVTANGSTSTKNMPEVSSEGWIEVGTYTFDGASDDENVTISVNEENVIYINCIKLESAMGELYVTAPVIEASDIEISSPVDGNTSAWVYAYNKTGTENEVAVLIAVYDKTTKQLVAPVELKKLPVVDNVIKISTDAISVSDSENVYVKAFVWNGMSVLKPLKPANEIGVVNN